jgi:hypothetical protein
MTETTQDTENTETTEAPGIAPEILASFEDAQSRGIQLLGQVMGQIQDGMSEVDIAQIANRGAADLGFTDWFEPTAIRVGGPTGVKHKNSASRTVSRGTLVEVNLAPATDRAFANVSATIAFETEVQPRIVQEAKELCVATCGFASRWKCTGEIFVFADAWTKNRLFTMGDIKAIGHQCLPPQGLAGTAWPRSARLATYLRRNQIEWYNHRRMAGIYTLRPRVEIDGQSAVYQEMLYVDGTRKLILGRTDASEIGTW